jgi:succinoglycan biosynthesis protein ExoL
MPALKILVLAHDLTDATVHKRVAMLREGGAKVVVAGFRRAPDPVQNVGGCPATNLGQTHNGRFAQRIWSVFREAIFLPRHRELFANADVILARNLEMLALGVRGRNLCRPAPILVYECLDIHRLLLGCGPIGFLLRTIEGWLTRRVSALVTSSPTFISHYFNTLSNARLPIKLVENKCLETREDSSPQVRQPGPPWTIGWFGVIRCQKSLRILKNLVQQCQGNVEVIIRGRPAFDQFEDFHKTVSETPGLRFLGPYKSPDDMASLYQNVHFTWTIDKFEEGMNSSWLLPNRLYEGGIFGAVPLAEKAVETGRFLKRLGIGVTLGEPLDLALASFFNELSTVQYKSLEENVSRVPPSTWIHDKKECEEFVSWLSSFKRETA